MVETIRLESGHTLTGIVGSNPTLSAIFSPTWNPAIRCAIRCAIRLGDAQRHLHDFAVRLRHLICDHGAVDVHGG